MKTLSKADQEFLVDIIKLSAKKFYKEAIDQQFTLTNKDVSKHRETLSQCILRACSELGYSVTPKMLSDLTYHIKNGREDTTCLKIEQE